MLSQRVLHLTDLPYISFRESDLSDLGTCNFGAEAFQEVFSVGEIFTFTYASFTGRRTNSNVLLYQILRTSDRWPNRGRL